MLVSHLPAESATGRTVRGHGWSSEQLLLADVVDLLNFWRAEWLRANGASGVTQPESISRPGNDREEGRRLMRETHDELLRGQGH